MKKIETMTQKEISMKETEKVSLGLKVRTNLKAGQDPEPIYPGK
jgi:hypothetical protein